MNIFAHIIAPLLHRIIIPIWGPFALYSYGFAIAIGVSVFIYLVEKDRSFLSLRLNEHFSTLMHYGIISAFIGGKLLYLITEQPSHLDRWALHSGFSILGAIIAVSTTIAIYLYRHQLAILPILDLFSIYIPLTHAISRVGCLAAGCCHGIPTQQLWAIKYLDPSSIAPIGIWLHPTQLYSTILFILLFFWQRSLRHHAIPTGLLFASYLIGSGIERFCIDFLRNDRIFLNNYPFSINQLIALTIGMIGCLLVGYRTIMPYKTRIS